MTTNSLMLGYIFSSFIGALLLWLVIDRFIWKWYFVKWGISNKPKGILTLPMGMVERVLYTTAFILNQQGFVAIWLALKVASQWKRWEATEERATYNVFLIGNGLSIILSFLGAWIALGNVPLK